MYCVYYIAIYVVYFSFSRFLAHAVISTEKKFHFRRKKKCARLKPNLLQDEDEDEDEEDCEFNLLLLDSKKRPLPPRCWPFFDDRDRNTKPTTRTASQSANPPLLHPMSILQLSSSPTKSNNIARSNFLYSKTTTPTSTVTSTRHD